MANLDWSQCPAVESIPGKVGGAWVFRGTRLPVATVIENLEDLRVEEVAEQFEVTREQIAAVLEFVAQSLKGLAPGQASESVDWLGKDHVLFLSGVPECDPGDLARLIEPLGLKGSITTRFALAESEIKRLVLERGVSYLWRLVDLWEDILGRTPDLPALLTALQNMLLRIAPSEELIIVDRWLLPIGCPDCLDTLTHLISPMPTSVSRVVLVTRKQHDEGLLNNLRTALKSRKCEVVHGVSENFHDRFWIADRARGLFVGTSPNGLGKRYALADYMAKEDVRAIIEALSAEGLLPQRNVRGGPPTIA